MLSVRLHNEQGEIPASLYTYSLSEDNIITVDLEHISGSFNYLVNKIYWLEIETEVSDDIDEDTLIKILENEGIPNQAKLVYGTAPELVQLQPDLFAAQAPLYSPNSLDAFLSRVPAKSDELYSNIAIVEFPVPENLTVVEGHLTWNHGDNPEDEQPEQITIQVLADGKIVEERVVTADENDMWKWRFVLPKYEATNEDEVIYSINELYVDGYKIEIDGYDAINTHVGDNTGTSSTYGAVDKDPISYL